MRRLAVAALVLCPSVALAAPLAPSLSGQPAQSARPETAITSGTVRVAVRQQVLPVGGRLAEHRQEGLRYLYVVSGRLKVSNLVTGQEELVEAGKMAAESAGDWHAAEVVGAAPVTLYVIDQVAEPALLN